MFAVCAAALFAAAASAQQDFSKVEIQTEKLADTVYMMTGAGGNLGLSVGEDAVFVIDDQFAPLTPKIQAAIASLTPKPVKFVLNTHWHFDHTGGNENLGKAGAIIVAHENVRKRLSTEGFIEFLGMKTKPEPKIALPVATFTRDILAACSRTIRGQIKAGKTLEQVIASKPTAKYDEVWGKGFLAPEKFVEMLYKNLKK